MVNMVRISEALAEEGIAVKDLVALEGGRTNRVYKAVSDDDFNVPLIVKLYIGEGLGNPLFPNLPHSEITALIALKGTGIAPDLILSLEIDGVITLIYRYIDAKEFSGSLVDAVSLLKRVHDYEAKDEFRRLAHHHDRWVVEGMAMLHDADEQHALTRQLKTDIVAICEELKHAMPLKSRYFLHGDCTVANILTTVNGLMLIDWQCPAIGDAIEDYATLASRAMHHLSNRILPNRADEEAMIMQMDEDIAERYRIYAPILKWRIACYCLLRATQVGNADLSKRYIQAAILENEGLKS